MRSLMMVMAALLAFAGGAREKPGFVKVEWSETGGEAWTVEGLRDREACVPMATNTVFAICSNTKPVTSVLVLTFVEEGVLDLDDPVAKYLPEFAGIRLVDGRAPKQVLTLRHLLTHLSGLAYSAAAKGRNSDMTSYAEQAEIAVGKGLAYEPGEKYKYCGLGFQVMGAVLEKVTGRKPCDLMRERIFEPLGMAETTFYPDAAMLARTAVPYYFPPDGGAPVKYAFENRWTVPLGDHARTALLSGGLFSTAGDYLKFSQMMARRGLGLNGRRILKEETFDAYLATRQTPPGDKVDASFDVAFNKDRTGGGKGGLFATSAQWNWKDRSCTVVFRAKSPYAPKGVKSALDATGFGGRKTTFAVSGTEVVDGGASCLVGNNEDRHGVGTVELFVNGASAGTRRVELAIGEAKRVAFKTAVKPGDKVEFKVR